MSEIFFTSDLHLGHDRDFIYSPRNFSSVEEHDETIIKNWNETVGPDDTVFVLGDIMMGTDREKSIAKLSRLNGHIKIILGNHDTNAKVRDYLTLPNIELTDGERYANIIKVGKWTFYISHRPTIMGDIFAGKREPREFCLHGHTHSDDQFQFIQYCCYNVAIDAHNNRPVNVKQIQEELREKVGKMRKDYENIRRLKELADKQET